jgi:Protein of unknown function (DUF1049).
MKLIYTVVIMLIVVFVVTFSLENTVPIPLKYYGIINVTAKSYLVIFISFFAGIIIAGLMDVVERFRLARDVKRLNKKIVEMEKKLSENENLPMMVETGP